MIKIDYIFASAFFHHKRLIERSQKAISSQILFRIFFLTLLLPSPSKTRKPITNQDSLKCRTTYQTCLVQNIKKTEAIKKTCEEGESILYRTYMHILLCPLTV